MLINPREVYCDSHHRIGHRRSAHRSLHGAPRHAPLAVARRILVSIHVVEALGPVVRSRPGSPLFLCAPLLLCALKLHGGMIQSPAGVMQEVVRSCSVLKIAAARRAGRGPTSTRELPVARVAGLQI